MGKYFGTDGFRGEVNVKLTADHAYRIGRFLGTCGEVEEKKLRILIGKDTRRSCDMFEHALIGGLLASGADVFRLGVVTTPAVAHLVRTGGFDLGVMISASHNAFSDNGIKLINRFGEKEEALIFSLETYLDGAYELPFATGARVGTVRDADMLASVYLDSLRILPENVCHGISVGLDLANGSTFRLARAAFEYLGAEITAIHAEPDGLNINRSCGSTHVEALQTLVREKNLDIGFAFDGDGDRCIAVSGKGEIISGDHLLYLFARFMRKKGTLAKNTVITTVMSNFGLYKALDDAGIFYEKTAVGDKFVWECMKNGGFSLGGEQSGHLILADHATTGDGILTALYTMRILLEEGKDISSLLAPFVFYPQVLENVRVCDTAAVLADEDVRRAVCRAEEDLCDKGRILLRASGTEPVLRIMAEAEAESLCQRSVASVIAVILQKGYAEIL